MLWAAILGGLILFLILWDTFETIVLPRTASQNFRLTKTYYRLFTTVWTGIARHTRQGRERELMMGAFGPLSLLLLLVVWACGLIVGFALLQWGLSSDISAPEASPGFGSYLYMSGSTFFTLGYGDVTPRSHIARVVAVGEAGVGFGFLAVVIGYLPVLYQAFSRRETAITLLDARAGSPPSAGELLRRYADANHMQGLTEQLREWEVWTAELMESHLSYPILMTYRSQHDRQSWLAALTMILDTCALIRLGERCGPGWEAGLLWQSEMTFAMARHACIDLSLVMRVNPRTPAKERMTPEIWLRLRTLISRSGLVICEGDAAYQKLSEMRGQYEPYVNGLATLLMLNLPDWLPEKELLDNWQTSAWEHEKHF